MTKNEWFSMTSEEQYDTYNNLEKRLFPLEEQISKLRQSVYLLRKILKWKGDMNDTTVEKSGD